MPSTRFAPAATRRSLIDRLHDLQDQTSWQRFFDTYGGLLYRVARKSGLTHAEAQEAVQETVITVSRNIGGLAYDPAVGSFKAWLLQTARWRIADQFRARNKHPVPISDPPDAAPRTALIDRLPDPAGCDLEALWDREWQQTILSAALAEVRKKVDPRQFQIFDCYVTKAWPASRVARELGVNVAQVYLAKHRVSAALKNAMDAIERTGSR